MQKKLIAVAVGGALAAVGAAPALAQNATVNVFGTLYAEFSSIDNGAKSAAATDGYQRYDHLQNPGSEIGFRGEEKLGGGLSAWFQCASTMDWRGSGNAGNTNAQAGSLLCTRNSALGVKGNFGNIFYGNWHTPFARISVPGNVGSGETGVFGNSHLMTGNSTTAGISSISQSSVTGGGTINAQTAAVAAGGAAQAAPVTAATLTATTVAQTNTAPGSFRRRQNSMFTYETPNFGGFSAMGSVTTRNYASAATQNQLKTRLWSVGGQYANGPVYIGLGYEKHSDFFNLNTAAAPIGSDERAWTIAGSYTFANRLKLGGVYHDIKANNTVASNTTVKTWHIGIDWMISGPHGVRAGYSKAGDVGGIPGTAMPLRPAAGPNTSAQMYQARYVYQASKRTEFELGYSRTNNASAATYETGGSSTAQLAGSDSSAIAATMRHRF